MIMIDWLIDWYQSTSKHKNSALTLPIIAQSQFKIKSRSKETLAKDINLENQIHTKLSISKTNIGQKYQKKYYQKKKNNNRKAYTQIFHHLNYHDNHTINNFKNQFSEWSQIHLKMIEKHLLSRSCKILNIFYDAHINKKKTSWKDIPTVNQRTHLITFMTLINYTLKTITKFKL